MQTSKALNNVINEILQNSFEPSNYDKVSKFMCSMLSNTHLTSDLLPTSTTTCPTSFACQEGCTLRKDRSLDTAIHTPQRALRLIPVILPPRTTLGPPHYTLTRCISRVASETRLSHRISVYLMNLSMRPQVLVMSPCSRR